jgi:hypothetical protein
VKTAINVFKDIGSLAQGFHTIGGIEHQWLISGKKPKTIFYQLVLVRMIMEPKSCRCARRQQVSFCLSKLDHLVLGNV